MIRKTINKLATRSVVELKLQISLKFSGSDAENFRLFRDLNSMRLKKLIDAKLNKIDAPNKYL
jgi:hypothetical protein